MWINLQTSVEPGGKITVRLAAINTADNFRGFLIHATNRSSQSFVALGSFINPPPNTKSVTCSPGLQVHKSFQLYKDPQQLWAFFVIQQNSLTHGDGRGKTTLDITWEAPADYQGDVEFRFVILPLDSKTNNKKYSFQLLTGLPLLRITIHFGLKYLLLGWCVSVALQESWRPPIKHPRHTAVIRLRIRMFRPLPQHLPCQQQQQQPHELSALHLIPALPNGVLPNK